MPKKEAGRSTSPTDSRADPSERIRRAGVALFRKFGYHGTSVRALADAVGLEAASLYHHFPSKQTILADIFDRAMDELADGLQQALDTDASYEQRLRDAVRFHVLYHIDRQDEAFISHSELRSLTAPNRARIATKRDRYEHKLRTFLSSGVEAGEFDIHDVPIMTIAILVMCSGVSDWFANRGRLSGDQVADAYAEIVLRLTRGNGHSGPGGSSGRNAMPGGRGSARAGRRSSARADRRPEPAAIRRVEPQHRSSSCS